MASSKPSPPIAPTLSTLSDTRKTMTCAYICMLTFIFCTLFIIFFSSSSSSPPWLLRDIFNLKNPSFYSNFFPNSSQCSPSMMGNNVSSDVVGSQSNLTQVEKNYTFSHSNQSFDSPVKGFSQNVSLGSDTQNSDKVVVNDTVKNLTSESQFSGGRGNETVGRREKVVGSEGNEFEKMAHCDLYDGKWVRDDHYPLYEPGSCPYIDEPFNCFLNGRPDHGFEKYRWQPNGCIIPRFNATHMLQLLKGKRLVFVGDSLNRNMWESLVCVLRNSAKDKSKVFEASGRYEFRTEGSYSFVFEDYNCSVEFFRSTFLVQEWEVPVQNGSKKETLRLDLVERSCDRYKDADILIFNTGHWWTHEKTSRGQNYYQEGSHVYSELDVNEAFRKAMTTWARWVETNVDPAKTQVFFRGYSSSHFGGGEWYSGGKCDNESEPYTDDKLVLTYLPIMPVLENVIKWMKTPVSYLNITKMTDYRKDAHPAVFRAQELTEEERRSPLRYQDCSHWCLPGVPETWNELVYAEILIRNYQKQQQEKQRKEHR